MAFNDLGLLLDSGHLEALGCLEVIEPDEGSTGNVGDLFLNGLGDYYP